jgi:hypothetical protein
LQPNTHHDLNQERALARSHWHDLPDTVRTGIQARTGIVADAVSASAGRNSAVAVILDTPDGKIFVKGTRADRPQAVTQRREAEINPHVLPVAPRLLWHLKADGWDLLGFQHVQGRPVDLAPGSTDLPAIAAALTTLAGVPCPALPLKRIEQRWAEYANPAALELLAGETLLHTDLHPDNMLTNGQKVYFVDWAWPTMGAAWVDTAILALWLIASGHSVAQAEDWARRSPTWHTVSDQALDTFTHANTRLWDQIATADPQPWKRRLADVAQQWSQHRLEDSIA